MEAPFTAQEVLAAFKATKTGSALWPNGFLALYYRKFQDALIPHLVKYVNAIRGEAHLDSSSYVAYISVVPKPNKDPGEVVL